MKRSWGSVPFQRETGVSEVMWGADERKTHLDRDSSNQSTTANFVDRDDKLETRLFMTVLELGTPVARAGREPLGGQTIRSRVI